MALPKGVHRVVSRGREYFYWQPGRNTASPGERVKLPSDPQSPEFWAMLAQLQGAPIEPVVVTITNSPATLVLGTDRVGDITDCATTNRGLAFRE